MTDPAAKDFRMWAMLCHLSALSKYVVPFGHILGPLLVWQLKRNDYPALDGHGKEALNFQISMTIYILVSVILAFVLIGFLLIPLLVLADLILVIVAGIKANGGDFYQYPITIRFLK